MINELKKYINKEIIVLFPSKELEHYDSINGVLENIVIIDDVTIDDSIVEIINNSKIKKIYLFADSEIYRSILPKIKKSIKVCWIFKDSFSALSNYSSRSYLNFIFEYYDRKLIDTIGCISLDTKKIFSNSGYNCEYIELKLNKIENETINSNSIGILSDDADPNNNFYNQLAALTFVDYDVCKFQAIMRATKHFYKYFNINAKVLKNIDEVMKDNFVNLYINFTNTNKELILKSYNYGVPVIVGNTDFYDQNDYLKENLVVKSDDDINEIVEKINFVKENYKRIIEEYKKIN